MRIGPETQAWSQVWQARLSAARAHGDMEEALRLRREDAAYFGFDPQRSLIEERGWWANRRQKPHLWRLPNTLGTWVVNVGSSRVIGFNNTFRTFGEACRYARRLASTQYQYKEAHRG